MVSKVIAACALLTLMTLNALANFWYTYGIWPRSWLAFVSFWACGVVLSGLLTYVTKSGD